MSRRLRLTAICTQFPLPADSGGPVRLMGLIRALAEAHELDVVAIRRPDTAPADELALAQAISGTLHAFDLPAQRGGPAGFAWRWAEALAGGAPPWILARRSPQATARVADLAGRCDALVLLDDYAGILLPERLPGGCVVVTDKHNVMGWSVRERRGLGGATSRSPVEAVYAGLTRSFERSRLARCRAIVVTSAEESERLRSLYGRAADAVVPSGAEVPERPSARADPLAVGWLGFLGYYANAAGLGRLLAEAWLGVVERTGATLHLFGGGTAQPPLPVAPNVEAHGFVADLDGVLDRVGVGVVPLWHGAGVKLKTLTMMAAGIPLAVTPVAIEGIQAIDEVHCLVGATPAELGDAVVRLIRDPALAASIALAGRELVSERYSWPALGAAFREQVERAVRS